MSRINIITTWLQFLFLVVVLVIGLFCFPFDPLFYFLCFSCKGGLGFRRTSNHIRTQLYLREKAVSQKESCLILESSGIKQNYKWLQMTVENWFSLIINPLIYIKEDSPWLWWLEEEVLSWYCIDGSKKEQIFHYQCPSLEKQWKQERNLKLSDLVSRNIWGNQPPPSYEKNSKLQLFCFTKEWPRSGLMVA